MYLLSVGDVAKELGTSHATARRRIKASGLGVMLASGTILGVERGNVARIATFAAGKTPASRQASTDFIYVSEAARRLKGSVQAVLRAVRVAGVGVRVSGRMAAVSASSLPRIAAEMKRRAGNPNWIARRGASQIRRKGA